MRIILIFQRHNLTAIEHSLVEMAMKHIECDLVQHTLRKRASQNISNIAVTVGHFKDLMYCRVLNQNFC